MEEYIGVKKIKATRMNKGEAASLIGYKNDTCDLPDHALGYLVEYEGGYQSWSPKKVFDKAYIKVKLPSGGPVILLPDHLLRAYDEAIEVAGKAEKLRAFIETNEKYKALNDIEQNLMSQQLMAMEYYISAITLRMRQFTIKN